MAVRFEIRERFQISSFELYEAWLDSRKHSEMTGGEAVCSSEENGTFSAWDGYITGSNVSLNPSKEIIQ